MENLRHRKQAAYFIQKLGERLKVMQTTINTAVLYMHMFFESYTFKECDKYNIAMSALFLSCKMADEPRNKKHVVQLAHYYMEKFRKVAVPRPLKENSSEYLQKCTVLERHEQLLLVTLGFSSIVVHLPHQDILELCNFLKANEDYIKLAYMLATYSLHLTTLCVRYSPNTVACVCMHLACKLCNLSFPLTESGEHWSIYADSSEVTLELLEELANELHQSVEEIRPAKKRKLSFLNQELHCIFIKTWSVVFECVWMLVEEISSI